MRGSSVPTIGDQQPVDRHAQRGEQSTVGALRRLQRGEPLVVDTMRRHDDRRPHIAPGPQPVLGHLADADQHGGLPCGAADGATEEGCLGAHVPFGVVEERAVVDRHRTRHRRSRRHGVVRSVVDLDLHGAQHGTETDLFEDEPARPRDRDRTAYRRTPGQAVPALLVIAAGNQRQIDVVTSIEALRNRHGVVPGSTGADRDGRDVERDVERSARHVLVGHSKDRQSSTWARAVPRHVRVAA